jgi:hypothetical protein
MTCPACGWLSPEAGMWAFNAKRYTHCTQCGHKLMRYTFKRDGLLRVWGERRV